MRMPASADPLWSADRNLGRRHVHRLDVRQLQADAVQRRQQRCLERGALLEGDLLALQRGPSGDVRLARRRDQLVGASGVGPPGHRDQTLLGGLGEDQRSAADEAGVDRTGLERLEHRRTADEGRVLDLVREVRVLTRVVQHGLQAVQLVADAQRGAGRDVGRQCGGRRAGGTRVGVLRCYWSRRPCWNSRRLPSGPGSGLPVKGRRSGGPAGVSSGLWRERTRGIQSMKVATPAAQRREGDDR